MATQQARPYRSHRVPACDKCRQRKVRCVILIPGTPCQLCETKGFACLFDHASARSAPDAESSGKQAERPRKRARRAHDQLTLRRDESLENPSSPGLPVRHEDQSQLDKPNPSSTAESSIIIAPMVAEDVQILLHHLETGSTGKRPAQRYTVASSTPGKPVLHMAIPRAREGSRPAKDPGRGQREILEQILGPFADHVVKLYFECVHPCFPVVDEEAFWSRSSRVSSSLYCQIYAISLTYWNCSDTLKCHPCPSSQYFWESAIAALQEDFLAPHLATLYPALIDLSGRPLGAIQGNVVNAGRTVALAHSLGLNRDPRVCSMSSTDIRSRIRLFWAVLIHDHWSSFAYGVPPSVLRRQYDVPLPVLSDLFTPNKQARQREAGAESFIQLCKLSEILGDILPLVYDLSNETQPHVWKDLRRFECSLDQWEEELPQQFKQPTHQITCAGASSLFLGFLSIKMLLCRLGLRTASSQENGHERDTTKKYYLSTVRASAIKISEYVCSLQPAHLKEFWMPYAAHLLVSAGTVLLRCAVDTTEAAVAQSCKDALASLQDRLRRARDEENWDLADMFTKRCDDAISNILAEPEPEGGEAPEATHLGRANRSSGLDSGVLHMPEAGQGASGIYMPMESLEGLWDPLWDVWQTNIHDL
ncbi:C6 transcription factor [Phyllosticta citribraziliensis]|uniref:C6 transcription factor n=1 Tax=Phyllosticta citribraziliensis TaxID=989973 RepID=A0ABR1M054_9PEZI